MFDDVLAANERFRETFEDTGLPGRAAKGLAVLTCIDSRIDPLAMLGLEPGDAKIIRNAGARASEDALRSLVLAVNLLDVTRVCVVAHTDCAMMSATDDEMRRRITEATGVDASTFEPRTASDPAALVQDDLDAIAAHPLLPDDLEVGGFVFDVRTGRLEQLATPSR